MIATDWNKYQTKISLYQQAVTHLKSAQIGKISVSCLELAKH